jgi:thioredoxin 1
MRNELLKFIGSNCGGCKVLNTIIKNEIDYPVTEINVDDNPKLKEHYGIMSVPSLVMLKDGEEVGRLVGVQAPEVIKELIEKGN